MEDALEQAINIFDLEDLARERLTPMAYDYYASGAHDEVALRENRAAFERIKLRHRVLVDVSERDARTTVLGHPVSTPILIAPTAFQGMACADASRSPIQPSELQYMTWTWFQLKKSLF